MVHPLVSAFFIRLLSFFYNDEFRNTIASYYSISLLFFKILKHFAMKKIFFLFTLFLTNHFLIAQKIIVHNIKTIPSQPKSTDNVKVVLKVLTTSGGQKISFNVDKKDNVFNAVSCFFLGVTTEVPTYYDTIQVGKLPKGVYQVIYKAIASHYHNKCIGFDSVIIKQNFEIDASIGLSENQDNQPFCIAYPNPNQGNFNITFSQPIQDDWKINVFNILGQKNVFKEVQMVENQVFIDLGTKVVGIYLIEIIAEQKRLLKPIYIYE